MSMNPLRQLELVGGDNGNGHSATRGTFLRKAGIGGAALVGGGPQPVLDLFAKFKNNGA